MEVLYSSTRSKGRQVKASEAILKGLADDGGLFVPDHIPALDKSLKELSAMSYREVAYEVMKLFLTDFTEEELKNCIERAYDEKFDTDVIAPLVETKDAYYLELFHGATIAFKDMALSILPHLMITSARKNQICNEIVILTATSGDTGKAALAGFAGVEGTKIIVFYPKNGVSPIQEKQMVTQKGDNTFVVGIHGNFDDAQSGVKAIFGDKALAEEMDKAMLYFNKHYSDDINIEEFASSIHMSTSWFIRNFKQYTGQTPMQYILSIRIVNAEHLLETTDYNLTEISRIIGYENPLYFSRIFKKQKGLSPSEYRKSIKKS